MEIDREKIVGRERQAENRERGNRDGEKTSREEKISSGGENK